MYARSSAGASVLLQIKTESHQSIVDFRLCVPMGEKRGNFSPVLNFRENITNNYIAILGTFFNDAHTKKNVGQPVSFF